MSRSGQVSNTRRVIDVVTARRDHLNHISAEASAGKRVPSLPEVLDGCALFRDDVHQDAGHFAARAVEFLDPQDLATHALILALSDLTEKPVVKDYITAAEAIEGFLAQRRLPSLAQMHGDIRCYLYAALSGHAASIHKVAAFAVARAYEPGIEQHEAIHRARSAVGWLLAATGQIELPERWSRNGATVFLEAALAGPGEQMMAKMLANRSGKSGSSPTADQAPARTKSQSSLATQFMKEDETPAPDETGACGTGTDARCQSDIVFMEIGNLSTAAGQRVFKEFKDLLNLRLPLEPVSDLAEVRRSLHAEFPHAAAVTEVILGELVGRPYVALRPTLLVGPPGCGKTTYALRLATLLNLPSQIYGCGGVADAAFAGTARRWSTGGPSSPASLMRDYRHASPAVILDEVDKAGTAKVNGSLLDALLSMLEPRTARCWRDPYLEAPVNLAHVIWFATANGLDDVPVALRDRFLALYFPKPRSEHLASLAGRILESLTIERGLDRRWALPLDGVEFAALEAAWQGGSLRRLTRLVGTVLATRERPHVYH